MSRSIGGEKDYKEAGFEGKENVSMWVSILDYLDYRVFAEAKFSSENLETILLDARGFTVASENIICIF